MALEETAGTSANASLGDLDIVFAKGRHWPLVDLVLLMAGYCLDSLWSISQTF